jgi:hypothetical protein
VGYVFGGYYIACIWKFGRLRGGGGIKVRSKKKVNTEGMRKKVTDLELEQWARLRANAQFEATMQMLVQARQRGSLDITKQNVPIERDMMELIMLEVLCLRGLMMHLLVAGGLVRGLSPEEAKELIEKQRKEAENAGSETVRGAGEDD